MFAPDLTGEFECDESHFGGSRRGGHRDRAVGQKVIVCAILKRQGRVSMVIVPRADACAASRPGVA